MPPELASAFIALRSRYEALMDMPISADPFEIMGWLDALDGIIQDALKAGLRPSEVCHK